MAELFRGRSEIMTISKGPVSNCNDCLPQTIYEITGATNRPPGMTTHLLICLGYDDMKLQIASDDTLNLYYRTFYQNTWKAWKAV